MLKTSDRVRAGVRGGLRRLPIACLPSKVLGTRLAPGFNATFCTGLQFIGWLIKANISGYEANINLEYQFLKETLADNPEEKSVRDGKKGEDISLTVQTEQEANFDVTKVGFGSFSWD